MADPYRTSSRACPDCGNSALRTFGERLVCDECSGMLLSFVDLAHSIHELDDGKAEAAVTYEKPSDKTCPRCEQSLVTAHVAYDKVKLGRAFVCKTDGVWCTLPALTGAFAVAGRSRHSHFSQRTFDANLMSNSNSEQAAIQGIRNAFGRGPATAGLAIGHYWENNAPPRVHTLFVSAYKDRTLGCPSCRETKLVFRVDRWECDTCRGCFVEDAALSAMITAMTNKPWEFAAIKGGPGSAGACPVCEAKMSVEPLEAVTIDRCEKHGVFFDRDELQAALHHAAEPSSIGGWLKQLFHRHGETA